MPDGHELTYAFVVNPVAEDGLRDQLEGLVERHRLRAHWLETTEDDPGVGQTSQALDGGADVIVACGGDGTVRACLAGAAGVGVPVGIVPAGTGNLLALNLGIPTEPGDAIDLIIHGTTGRVDLGTANDEVFAIMAGIGLDATIMDDTARDAKDRWGTAAYVATAIRHLGDDPFGCAISTASDTLWEGPATAVLIGNHGRLQGGVELFPDAANDDGRLDLLVASGTGLADWISTAAAVLTNEPDRGPVDRFVSDRFMIEADRPVPYEIDGEPRRATRVLDVSLHDATVDIIVPSGDETS